jgi:hypothetical protein
MPDAAFWLIAIMYSILGYLHGHQGSHLAAIKSGQAELNPVLRMILKVNFRDPNFARFRLLS